MQSRVFPSLHLIHPSTFGPPWPHSSLQRSKQLKLGWVSSTYVTLNSEMSIDFEWPSNTRSSSIQKCLFIGMSHTGHQNFRVCNPACGCDRVWFPPACVCQRPAVTESVPELSVGCVRGGRVLVWRVGSVDGMNGTSGWLWVYVCGCHSKWDDCLFVFGTCWTWVCLWLWVCVNIFM